MIQGVTLNEVLWGVGIFSASVIISLGLVALVLVRMPETYFLGDAPPSLLSTRPAWQQKAARIGKNVLGVLLVVIGLLLSIPGVPGQGLMTILIGITLVDFPGKRRFEQRIMRNKAVLGGANGIRRRFGKAPFQVEPPPSLKP